MYNLSKAEYTLKMTIVVTAELGHNYTKVDHGFTAESERNYSEDEGLFTPN
jgi:hypothetical protein